MTSDFLVQPKPMESGPFPPPRAFLQMRGKRLARLINHRKNSAQRGRKPAIIVFDFVRTNNR
ncbi:MAG: hypothetical protein QNK56_06430, partial [Pontimonas sp.]